MAARTPPNTHQKLGWAEASMEDRRQVVRGMRTLGLSLGEIANLVPVAKSTASIWCKGIELTDRQREAIHQRNGAPSRRGKSVDTQRRRRLEIVEIRGSAASYYDAARDDPLFVAGTCLYWAEGSKTKNDLSITNSDPAVLRIFVEFVRQHLDIHATFGLSLHLHSAIGEEMSKRFWRTELDLPDARFTKTYIKRGGTGHRKKKLPHGICRVRVDKASNHWHRVMQWIEEMGADLGG